MEGIIYKWTNKKNCKKYVGQTVNPRKRYLQHKRGERADSQIIDRAILKYGAENFDYTVLLTIHADTREELRGLLDEAEIALIRLEQSYYKTGLGYNMTLGGMTRGSYNHSEETRLKLSKIKKGKKLSEAAKRNIAEGHRGLKLSEQHKASLQKAHKADMRRIRQLTVNGVLIAEYDSIKAAERTTGINRGGISACINGRQQRTTGRDGVSYLWKLAG
jgi:group I intron endonuclease|nr:MAG TPA: intron associated endonuclease [Caudoviricetes sp.]